MGQSVYYAAVVVLSIANVVLAGLAFHQRSRQLAGRRLAEAQVKLAEQRNQMAADRVERLDRQVVLLRSIRDSLAAEQTTRARSGQRDVAGVIDVGSTTVRLVVVGQERGGERRRALADERAFLHLGADLAAAGRYSDATMHTVATRVAAFEHHARSLGCDRLAVVVTAPGRLGENPDELVEMLTAVTTGNVFALSAEEEAELAFCGASLQGAGADQRLAVCDVGGGSTEIAFGTRRQGVTRTACFEIGALTLAEQYLDGGKPDTSDHLEHARRAAAGSICLDDAPSCDLLLATGGSARSLLKLVGPVADADALEEGLALALDPPKRVARRLHRRRRRSLPTGILLLAAVQSQLGLPVTVSRSGMREGILDRLLADAEPRPPGVLRRAS